MSGWVTIPMALRLIGGFPLLPEVRVFANRLPVAKSLMGAGLGGLLGQVLNGGLGSVFQNPIGAIAGQLGGGILDAVGSLNAAFPDLAEFVPEVGEEISDLQEGFDALIGGLENIEGGLQGALNGLVSTSNLLSGVAGFNLLDGQFGLIDVITHGNMADILGDALPASLGLDRVIGPLMMGGDLAGMVSNLPAIVQDVIDEKLTFEDALGLVNGMRGQIEGVMGASSHALSSLQGNALGMAVAAAGASSLMTGVPAIRDLMSQVIRAPAREEIEAAWDALEGDEEDDASGQ